jgi:hypothetical protein
MTGEGVGAATGGVFINELGEDAVVVARFGFGGEKTFEKTSNPYKITNDD